MLKKSFLFAAGLFIASGAFAVTLTPEQALQRAGTQNGRRGIAPSARPELVYTLNTKVGTPSVYVFNNSNNGGYMVLSADDMAIPVLGYTDTGDFDPANVPPQMQYWLEEYSNQIAYAREHASEIQTKDQTISFPSSWTAIEPMVTTQWGQGDPFNQMTPTLGASHYSTGCVATAVAQVMKYWNWPERATGEASYYCAPMSQTLRMNLGEEAFDWDNMLDNYISGQYNTTQAHAVAYLMKACGYASQMQYNNGGSGTQSELAGLALSRYFGYDPNIVSVQRLQYTASEWNALVYDQLKNVGPIIYSGSSTEGAHCFVLDGYEGDGYFHFNWGWSGVCNGYYTLGALNPVQQGTGGFFGGYNFIQSILKGVQKPTGEPVQNVTATMTLNGTVQCQFSTSGLIQFTLTGGNPASIGNDSMEPIRPTFGIEIQDVEGGMPFYITCGSPAIGETFPQGSYWEAVQSSTYPVVFQGVWNLNLADGRYKATVVCKNNLYTSSSWQHFILKEGNYDYAYLNIKNGEITVENFSPMRFEMTDAKIITPLYYNNPCMIEMSFKNPYDAELTQSVLPLLYKNNRLQYKGESQLITLMPNETKTIKMFTTLARTASGETPLVGQTVEFDFIMQDYQTGENYGNFGKVSMGRSSSNVRVSLDNMEILNAKEETEENGKKIFGTNEFGNIVLETSFTVKGGFIATPITASIYEYDLTTNTQGRQVYEKTFENMVFAEAGESATESSILNFMDPDVSKVYQITGYYMVGTSQRTLGSIYMRASSGVDEITSGNDGFELNYVNGVARAASDAGQVTLYVYDSKGQLVGANYGNIAEYSLFDHTPGLYIIYASDADGRVKTIKVIK